MRDRLDSAAEVVASWVLERTAERPLTLTPRRLRRLASRLASVRPSHLETRELMTRVLEILQEERRVEVHRKGSGRRVAMVMPSWMESPYLDAE